MSWVVCDFFFIQVDFDVFVCLFGDDNLIYVDLDFLVCM